ncbi:MAG: transporter substrate-binding domain-containing protein [Kaiparowitsia implicata GSE-PSE-MK54-09C]|jgi:polar amino acid transport system substrate-binding protein|nr:transporter substrate-binding domain-containing protein [Kaiparowitsia implicata GSE-PSE-MK54-09C]
MRSQEMGWAIAASLLLSFNITPTVLAAELSEIRQRGFLVVAVKDNLPPLGFSLSATTLDGFEIEIARRLAEQILGDPNAIVLRPVLNQERIPLLLADEVDLVIARLTITDARARLVDFSSAYYLDSTALITRADRPQIQRLVDMRRGAIAVLQGSSTVAVVRSRLPQAQLVSVPSYQAGQQLLDAGEVQAFAADASVLTGWVLQSSRYRLLPELLSGEPLAVAMPRGQQFRSLRQAVNGAIAQWQEDGWLIERTRFWQLPLQPSQRQD